MQHICSDHYESSALLWARANLKYLPRHLQHGQKVFNISHFPLQICSCFITLFAKMDLQIQDLLSFITLLTGEISFVIHSVG